MRSATRRPFNAPPPLASHRHSLRISRPVTSSLFFPAYPRNGLLVPRNSSSESKVQIKYCHELSEVVYEKGDADALCEAVERKGAHLKQSWPLSHGGSGCAALMALLPWDDTEVLVVAFRGTAVTVEWIEYLKGESGSGVFSMWLDTLNEVR